MAEQRVLTAHADYAQLSDYLREQAVRRILLVCDSSLPYLRINGYFQNLTQRTGIEVIPFSDFQPNPLYESVVKGVALFRQSGCDLIIGVGGGSAMDVAKCIKLYANMDPTVNYLKQTIVPNDVKLLAIPTTAGTGSESTRYAVIYYEGEKQSVADESCIPSVILMDASALRTLPVYQKKSTMMDAMCHAVESFWSVNANAQSQRYAKEAIEQILQNAQGYLNNEESANANMLHAANLAGKAINITQTTAGHAMCYKLTSLYGIAHGHAAALCVAKLWPFMLQNTHRCIDARGEDYLKTVFDGLRDAFGTDTPEAACGAFTALLESLELPAVQAKEEDYALLRSSVNPVRLKNHPIALDENVIDALYHQILA